MASVNASQQHRALDEPFRNERLRNIQQYLVDHGVNQQSARHTAANDFYNWSLDDINKVFKKVTTSDSDAKSLETDWLNQFLDIIADGTTSEVYWTKPPGALIERSAKEGLALCVNKDGEFDLRDTGYYCISHVWEEGIRADTHQNRGILTHRIKQIFRRISKFGAEWIWLDGLAIPSGSRSLTFKEEESKTAIINSLAKIYEKCEAVVVLDALTMHLRSSDPIECAMVLICGKWMTRVWTWQEVKIARKAIVLTATSTIDLHQIWDTLRLQAGVGPGPRFERGPRDTMADRKFYESHLTIACVIKVDGVGISLADIVTASKTRKTGNDIDYARAYSPALGLKWRTRMGREEAMQMVYESKREQATCLVLMHGSPRTSVFPGWAPSYLKGLLGPVLAPIPYEPRGIRRDWHTMKVKRNVPIDKPQKLLLEVESFSEQPPLCGCLIGEGESQATLDGIGKAIDSGNAYLLSDVPLYPIVDWAKQGLLVERVELDQDDEAYVYLTVEVNVLQPGAVTWETKWLLRHESPISEDGRFFSQLRVDLGHDHNHGKHKMIDAAYNGDKGLVESLMSDLSEVSHRNEKGWTPLHAVSIAGHLDIARILLRKPLRFNTNAHDNVGRTPLMLAAETGHDDIIDLLIDSGADSNYEHSESLMSVLNQAIKYERPSTLQLLLLKGADPNKPNGMGLTRRPATIPYSSDEKATIPIQNYTGSKRQLEHMPS